MFRHFAGMIEEVLRVQGRCLSGSELVEIQCLIDTHPEWSRHQVGVALCEQWNWRTPGGRLKSFAARSLLLKLAERHGLRLPAVRMEMRRRPWGLLPAEAAPPEGVPSPPPLVASLASLQPLQWRLGAYGTPERARALAYLRQHHYLGCNRPVGTHLLYGIQDANGRDLAVHLVGAAAWQCAPRDLFIGWSSSERGTGLTRIGNHSRFLVLPWVRVPQLASHLLGTLARRLELDWPAQHGWRLELLESFVENPRFRGSCYRAANWQCLGQTTGRTRQEKHHRPQAPLKSVWVYPLERRFRDHLRAPLPRGGGQ